MKTNQIHVSPIAYFSIGLSGALLFIIVFTLAIGLFGFDFYGYIGCSIAGTIIIFIMNKSIKSVNKR